MLRYFSDTQMARSAEPARARRSSARRSRSTATRPAREAAYAAALTPPPARGKELRYVDYGSDLRDNAALLAFAAGDKALQPRLTMVMDRITELFARSGETSTQEKAWLLMAAEAAAKISGGEMTSSTINGGAAETIKDPLYCRRPLGAGAPPVSVANKGTSPIWRSVSITGVVKADLPAENKGYIDHPRRLPPRRVAGRSDQGAADRSVRGRPDRQARPTPRGRRAMLRRRPAAGRVRDRKRQCRHFAAATGRATTTGSRT